MRHPKDIGDRSTLAIVLALHDQGYTAYLPFGENSRCDLITNDGRRLSRVQCKTGRLVNGSVRFRTSSSYLHHPNPKIHSRPYHGEVDEFVFCPELGSVYLIPIDDLPTNCSAHLRVDPTRNNQSQRIRQAAAYEIARVELY